MIMYLMRTRALTPVFESPIRTALLLLGTVKGVGKIVTAIGGMAVEGEVIGIETEVGIQGQGIGYKKSEGIRGAGEIEMVVVVVVVVVGVGEVGGGGMDARTGVDARGGQNKIKARIVERKSGTQEREQDSVNGKHLLKHLIINYQVFQYRHIHLQNSKGCSNDSGSL